MRAAVAGAASETLRIADKKAATAILVFEMFFKLRLLTKSTLILSQSSDG
jgi:hypothetical protein